MPKIVFSKSSVITKTILHDIALMFYLSSSKGTCTYKNIKFEFHFYHKEFVFNDWKSESIPRSQNVGPVFNVFNLLLKESKLFHYTTLQMYQLLLQKVSPPQFRN